MTYRIRKYGPLGEWIWELVADNGRVVALSTSSFTTEEGAARSARKVAEAHGGGFYYIDRPSKPVGIAPPKRATA